jgi:hypothetical protein
VTAAFPRLLALALALAPALSAAQAPNPTKLAPRPTTGAVTAADLMTRLYTFADDSMQGRDAGTPGNVLGNAYIAAELKRLGLTPAGDSGSYFQTVPMVSRRVDSASVALQVGSAAFSQRNGMLVMPPTFFPFAVTASVNAAPSVYGGTLGDSSAIAPDAAKGKVVVFAPPKPPAGQPPYAVWNAIGEMQRYRGAAAILITSFDITPPQLFAIFGQSQVTLAEQGGPGPKPAVALIGAAAVRAILGTPTDSARVGAAGQPVSFRYDVADVPTPAPARNVVAVLPGTDRRLRGQYVAIGAHNDHVGLNRNPVDHDSVKVWHRWSRVGGAEGPPRPLSAEESATARRMLDSIRALRPPRPDSIFNGADDDGSGSMGLLELAEWYATRRDKPRRSILFVWHVAEEKGLFGSQWFTEKPTVPRDSIVAQLNLDMIGRGGAEDAVVAKPGEYGGPDYLQLVGSRRLSTALGDLVERVNTDAKFGFRFDYQLDADGHPQNIYCRSDHYEYARWGIPVVFFTTGVHQDYHMVTDEPQYIDYPKYEKVTRFVGAVADAVANAPARPAVDKPKPDPYGLCRQ